MPPMESVAMADAITRMYLILSSAAPGPVVDKTHGHDGLGPHRK